MAGLEAERRLARTAVGLRRIARLEKYLDQEGKGGWRERAFHSAYIVVEAWDLRQDPFREEALRRRGLGESTVEEALDLYYRGWSRRLSALIRAIPVEAVLFRIPGLTDEKVQQLVEVDCVRLHQARKMYVYATRGVFLPEAIQAVLEDRRPERFEPAYHGVNAGEWASIEEVRVVYRYVEEGLRSHTKARRYREGEFRCAPGGPMSRGWPEAAKVVAVTTVRTDTFDTEGYGFPVTVVTARRPDWPTTLLWATSTFRYYAWIREVALKRGFRLSHDGLWRDGERIVVTDERGIYETLGLRFDPPSNRE